MSLDRSYGEIATPESHEDHARNDDVQVVNEDRYKNTMVDATCPKLKGDFTREAPNSEVAKFFELLQYANEPLWDGCEKHTRMSAVYELMNWKLECNVSESCYNEIIALLKSMLPEDAELPGNFYESKKMVKGLILGYEKIHGVELTKEAENILSQVSLCSVKKPSTYTSSQLNNEAGINVRVQEQIEPIKLQMEKMKKLLEGLQKTMPPHH